MNATKITTGMDTNVKLSGSDRGSGVSDPTEGETTMNSPKRLARIAGILYLFVGIFGGFAEGFVYPKMYVAGDHGQEPTRELRTCASRRRRRPVQCDSLGLPRNDPLPAAQARAQRRGQRNGRSRRNRGQHRMPQHGLRV